MRILGLDPSLTSTGWGVIEIENNRVKYIADGYIQTDTKASVSERLGHINKVLREVIELYQPSEASVE